MEQSRIILNKFSSGVNTDIAEDVLPNTFLSGGHNIKFTNHDNKQGIVQKQESYIKQLDGYDSTLIPLAAQVFNDVIYIVSYRPIDEVNPIAYVEIGTFPSADMTSIPDPLTEQTRPKIYKYAPLPNYKYIPYVAPTGSFSVAGITGINNSESTVDVTYDPGSSESGWIIEKVSGNALATFSPSYSSASTITVSVTISGSDGDTAIYRLRDIATSVILDASLTITIENTLGTAVITDVYGVDYEAITIDAEITSDGGDVDGVRGVCWNTTGMPDIADDFAISGTGEGEYTIFMTSLIDDTTYYIRAYYTNEIGTSYSDQEIQLTLAYGVPTLTIVDPYGLTSTTANILGTVTDDGGGTLSEVGAVYGITINPALPGDDSEVATLSTTIQVGLSALIPETLYYVRTYATNEYGTGYSANETFITPASGTTPATGDFSENMIEGVNSNSFVITVTYDPGDNGIDYVVEIGDNTGAIAVFDPNTGTTSGSVAVTIYGIPGQYAYYHLKDVESSNILATIYIILS